MGDGEPPLSGLAEVGANLVQGFALSVTAGKCGDGGREAANVRFRADNRCEDDGDVDGNGRGRWRGSWSNSSNLFNRNHSAEWRGGSMKRQDLVRHLQQLGCQLLAGPRPEAARAALRLTCRAYARADKILESRAEATTAG